MKDVYMANLLSKNNDTEINLDDCPVVVRFRKALFFFPKQSSEACLIRMASRVEEMSCTHGDENIEGDEDEDEDNDISSGSMRKRKKIFAHRKNFRKLRFSFAFSMKPKLCFCFIRGDVLMSKLFISGKVSTL